MKLLQFFSFGTWSQFLTEGQLYTFFAFFGIFCTLLIVKFIALLVLDANKSRVTASFLISMPLRVIQCLLFFVPIFLASLFSSQAALCVIMSAYIILFVVTSIIGIVDDFVDYVYTLNETINDWSCKTMKSFSENRAKWNEINQINKRINDYCKSAIK